MKARRRILVCAGTLVLGYLAAMLLLRSFEKRMVYVPSRALDAAPGDLGRPFEEAFIPVEGGERIQAWYFPVHSGQVQTNDRAVLVCHGNAGNISHRLDLAKLLLDAGASVLLFDYRGYGMSSGEPGEERTFQDAQAAWHWLAQKGFASSNIIAYGESLGGGVAAELAMRATVGGLILQSTFTSIPDIGAELFPWLPVRLISSIEYDTIEKLPRLKIPVLVMHSRQDEIIRYRHAERNFAAAHEPKFFCEIHGDHNGGLFESRAIALPAIAGFLRRPPSATVR